MNINLYFKTYPALVTQGAKRKFLDETGLDLWGVLIKVYETYNSCVGESLLFTMSKLNMIALTDTRFLTSDDAAKLLHAVISAEDKSIPLEEIEDAVSRSGWVPSDDKMCQPWTYVLLDLAKSECERLESGKSKKKADMLEREKEKARI